MEQNIANCHIYAVTKQRRCGGRVLYRWTTMRRKGWLPPWWHALWLPPKYENLLERRFKRQRYWGFECHWWHGLPYLRLIWLSERYGQHLWHYIPPKKHYCHRILPPLLFQGQEQHGDKPYEGRKNGH